MKKKKKEKKNHSYILNPDCVIQDQPTSGMGANCCEKWPLCFDMCIVCT